MGERREEPGEMTKTKKMKIEIKSCREISGKKETARTVSVTECTFLFFCICLSIA